MTQILGQSRAMEILTGALRSGRFQHGWIFSGPRGVGKFTAAVEVARVLLDPQAPRELQSQISNLKSNSPERGSPPNRGLPPAANRVQQLIDSGAHPDLHIIRKELVLFSDDPRLREKKQTNIPIDLLRERVIGGRSGETQHDAAAYRTAALGHGKVFIIDEAELLDPTGQNAMLKTLEEPPADTYFFLITSRPDRLLPTIRSRCQHVRFGRLDQAAMEQWLRLKAIEASQMAPMSADDSTQSSSSATSATSVDSLSRETLSWVLHFAEGSPGAAQLAIQYGFQQWQATLDPMLAELERGQFPAAMGETLAGLVEAFAVAWVKDHKNASKDAANKDGARHLFSLMAAYARNRLAERIDRREDASDWLAVIDLLRQAEQQLDSNVNLKLLLENLVVQWAQQQEQALAG